VKSVSPSLEAPVRQDALARLGNRQVFGLVSLASRWTPTY